MYQLLELDDKTLARLKPDSKIAGKKIRDMEDCHELDAAIAEMKGEKREGPSELAKAMGAIQVLRRVKEHDPALWSEVDDDVAALLGGPLPAKPDRAPTALEGATREERGRNLLALLRQVLAFIDDVDDVAGVLPAEIKQQAMVIAQAIWREVNRLPAYATLPAKEPSPGAPRRKGKVAP